MAKCVHATLEPNWHNNDGTTVVLYFDGEPTDDDVKQAVRDNAGGKQLWVNPDADDFEWEKHQTELSRRANTVRVECYPAG